ncbi:MAG: carboxypeptidase regulatory-like domain-containing protein [Thermoanaerobaculia bacterium]|nr:carboxypeptidase regulatory-like domain-containing protein [Thermoanaerobaculia bacterium]
MRLSGLFLLIIFAIAAPLQAQVGLVSGTVRSADINTPLRDMVVEAYNAAGFLATSTLTDSQGRYLLSVSPGAYRVLAYDSNGIYAVSFYGDAQSFESSEALSIAANQTVIADFRLPRGLQITGIVASSTNGGGIGGAVVAAYNLDGSRRTFTDSNADGSFTLVVPAGSYRVVAYHETLSFVPEFYRETTLFVNAATVTPPASGLVFTLDPGVRVHGVVTDTSTGTRPARMQAIAYDMQGAEQYRTDVSLSGEFNFVLPPGTYKFAAIDPQGLYQTTFYRSATSFASAASVPVTSAAVTPPVDIAIRRTEPEAKVTQWIIGAANAQGGSGTLQTDLWIYNPSADAEIDVLVSFLRAGQDNASATPVPVRVGPRQQVSIVNVIDALFGTTGTGALRFESNAPFRVSSRTFNIPRGADIGTFGLALVGKSLGDSHSFGTLPGLSNTATTRTNFALFNPQPNEIKVTIELFAADGTRLGTGEVNLRPSEWIQAGMLALTNLPADTPLASGYAILTSTEGSFLAYAATVDAKSGDATIVLLE